MLTDVILKLINNFFSLKRLKLSIYKDKAS